jgi:hypothetical protein
MTSNGPQSEDTLKNEVRKKIIHYHQLYADKPDPVVFPPITVNTSDLVYDDFVRLLFLNAHR